MSTVSGGKKGGSRRSIAAAALLTLAGDTLKGFVAVLAALIWLPEAAPYVGVAAFLGHLYPVYHRFQGGKVKPEGLGIKR